ncbi:ABC transporter ATP-binding protein [Candidatus Methylacidithermus pantelleriae]|uniref:ABC transporter ATP-binding protein n=1 Tax=Candidatus Methylacidithermus pantelleriae TaxID=2744239 RepID=A0A8J2FNG3_9BACT|nr:ABC transporter ATP-binding protein [Candidatus Methylacidithermus pantelleriae]CAF0695857.1 ABC transporter ATP-binding protein [Candidatus Methylacidithermus pantelleriae]
MTPEPPAIEVSGLSYRYGDRVALRELDFSILPGEIVGILGPNGSGKTTLFRILATLYPPQEGRVCVCGHPYPERVAVVREKLGVVFQAPSLDKKLTVYENLLHQGHLYGLCGKELALRIGYLLEVFRIHDRARDLVENLSGGLQRRVELAKGILHAPELLLMDEPTTGLDPLARREFWSFLQELQAEEDLTIIVTTHLMDEADRCDRLLVLDQGQLVAMDTPAHLRSLVSGTILLIRSPAPNELASRLKETLGREVLCEDGTLRLETEAESSQEEVTQLVGELLSRFRDKIESLTVAQPTLEDAFIRLTGHRFERNEQRENHG